MLLGGATLRFVKVEDTINKSMKDEAKCTWLKDWVLKPSIKDQTELLTAGHKNQPNETTATIAI